MSIENNLSGIQTVNADFIYSGYYEDVPNVEIKYIKIYRVMCNLKSII